jgi:hypothetical protein
MPGADEAPATVLNSLMEITRAAGKIGIPGLYVTDDPGAVDRPPKGQPEHPAGPGLGQVAQLLHRPDAGHEIQPRS